MRKSVPVGIGAVGLAASTSTPNWSLCRVSSRQGHHDEGMMCGGGAGKIGGRRAGGDDYCNRGIRTSIDHGGGGGHHPTAAMGMGPHSQRLSKQQSAKVY